MSLSSGPPIAQEEIAALAKSIWEQSGRPAGRDIEHWLRAERALRHERRQERQVSESATVDEAEGAPAGPNRDRDAAQRR
jgi:hypothetical protein